MNVFDACWIFGRVNVSNQMCKFFVIFVCSYKTKPKINFFSNILLKMLRQKVTNSTEEFVSKTVSSLKLDSV